MSIERECAGEPVVGVARGIGNHDVLRERVLLPLLRERELGEWQEVLVECHVVVAILKTCDARNA